MSDAPPQLPPTDAIQSHALQARAEAPWFEYPVRAHPHHTDYAGNVWHGAYVSWLEEARVECLRSIGIDFSELVALGCDLPVVELAIRYHRSIPMGTHAIVKCRMLEMDGVRINWDCRIQAASARDLFATATVTLVAVDREQGRILRQLPPSVKAALVKLSV
ncbi:putative thioesterase [Rubidibacter lacunae KORDI 51-2]|uniref:Putative thioesterase n=1 Tax=Rubidibacter lacunae KORDI 51-2 TaxID=582515 RepID=U5D6W0_9CHRO|nr:thioesterase family protein [Rubidibacter lacunae]ERN40393.1 putative thioesterase [Rubidibacter lacunae KORDI 51-2]